MISKLDNADYNVSTDYEDETIIKTALKPGHINCHFSNMDVATVSVVQSGSVLDICGDIWVFDSDTTPTGSLETGRINYLRVFDDSGSGECEYTLVAPSYNQELKGWYDSDTNLKRYILKMHDLDKYLITDVSGEDYSYQNEMDLFKNSVRTFLYPSIESTEIIHRDTDAVRRKNLNIGTDIAINQDYMVAGCPGWAYPSDYGALYVYKRTGPNTFSDYVTLESPVTGSQDHMGTRVSIDGDYILAGNPGYDPESANNGGALSVFHRTGDNVWDTGVLLTGANIAVNDNLGTRPLSIKGDYCAAGAYLHDNVSPAYSNSGEVYVFHRTGTNTWDSGTVVLGSTTVANCYYGKCVELYDGGDSMAIGSNGAYSGAGCVYIFERTGTNSWNEVDIIRKPSAFRTYHGFGNTCKISGDTMVMGIQSHYDDPGTTAIGAIAIYERNDGVWGPDPIAIMSNPEPTASSYFGYTVDIEGDTILSGCYRDPIGGIDDVGSAYIIYKDGTWKVGQKIIASDGIVDDRFSEGLALGPGLAGIGAPNAIDGGTDPEKYTKMYSYDIPMTY